MAISDTMSNHGDWAQFYQRTLAGQGSSPGSSSSSMNGPVSSATDATVVTTTITSSISGSPTARLNPEGRVSKPTRRRRASRAAPTTLLNTDTTNFRAMVQQFTGVPNAPFSFGPQAVAPNLNFGISSRPHYSNASSIIVPSEYHYHHQQQQQQQQQQQYMFSLNSTNDHGFMLNPRPNLEVSDAFLMEGMSSQMFPRSSSNENRGNGYNL